MNKTLYIITGLPYAGKSTLTKKLVEKFNFTVTSVDKFLDTKDFKSDTMSQADWDLVYSEAYKELELYLRENKDVIFDGGSLKKSERETLREIAKKSNANSKLIYVSAPSEKIKERWLENQTTKERGHLEENSLNTAFDMFEEPTPDENPIVYTEGTDFNVWSKENIA